jgi:hypothetical protein
MMKHFTCSILLAIVLLAGPGQSPCYADSEILGSKAAKILAEESSREKIKVVVLDFSVSFLNAEQKPSEAELKDSRTRFAENFIADVIQQLDAAGKRDRVAIVDRSRLDDILRDKSIRMDGATDRTALELGTLAGIDVVITGRVQVSGKTAETTVKVTRVKDAEILGLFRQGNLEKQPRPSFAPITVIDGSERLEIGAWKALPMNIEHPGTLHLTVEVEHGNALEVLVIPGPDLELFKNKKAFGSVTGFTAARTKHYQRKADLESGSYYLVLRDNSVGIFSTQRSDIKITARLEP